MLLLLVAASLSQPPAFLARNGRPEAVIVAGAGDLARYAAGEVQRHLEALSGARLAITSAPVKGKALILLGGPGHNDLVRRAAERKLVDFAGLKPDGYLLKRIVLDGQPALVAGGNDEAATLYAAYDLLERLGFVFLLTKEVLPEKRSTLELPALDERIEPAFGRRGVHVDNCYPNQSIWSVEYWKRLVDRMARMRMNYLQVFWFPNGPWLTYDYKGEKNFLGDVSTKESGYLLWAVNFGSHLARDMVVGREHFQHPRLAPPELQNVETPEQAFEKAQELLRQVIAHAKARGIKTWLAVDPVSMPANLARHARSRTGDLPFNPIMAGVYTCPADPVVDEINESRLKSLVRTYPEAEGYFLWFPESYPVCEDPVSRAFYARQRPDSYAEHLRLWLPYTRYERIPDRVVDSNNGAVEMMRKVFEARDKMNPRPRLGVGAFGRSYVYPIIDRLFPKDAPFTDMLSRAVWTPMGAPLEHFGGMGARERTIIARADDDGGMLGMQFSVGLFYQDRLFEGGLEQGVTGHAMQVNRARGMEQNQKFLADAAWRPRMKPEEFYREYVTRMFGRAAAAEALEAYRILEENEEYLGWRGRSNFGCCGPPAEISIIRTYSEQGNPYDGPAFSGWPGFLDTARARTVYFRESAGRLRAAAGHLAKAETLAAPLSRGELVYQRSKTEAYAMHLEALVQIQQAYLEFDAAFRARAAGRRAEFLERLDRSMEMFQQASRKSLAMAGKFAEIIDDPSDLGVLYRINIFMVHGFDIVEKFIRNIVDFHHGRFYLNPVPFEKVFSPWPRIQRARM